MKSCNRVIVTVLLCIGISPGCGADTPDLTTATIQNVGLVATSSTPPLGEGIAPLSGTGGDGSPSVPGKGIAEGGPGAVRWYGGQWLIPYSGRPGSTVQNVSCDVIANAQSTDLLELVGNAGVIGSVQGQAQNGTFRLWITPDTSGAHLPYAIADGEALALRHSPRDVATGGWTSGVEQMTIIGCAVNASRTITIPISPPYVTLGAGIRNFVTVTNSGPGGQTLVVPISVPVGHTIIGLRARVADSSGGPGGQSFFAHSLAWQGDGSEQFTTIAVATPSAGNGIEQTVSIPSLSATIGANREYFALLSNSSGTGTTIIYRLEADIL